MRKPIYNFSILIGLFFLGNAQESINNKELHSYLPSHITKTNFTLDDAKILLYKKCKKAIISGSLLAETQHKNVQNAADTLMDCGKNIANITDVMAEMEQARPKGELDVFLKKYCDKVPQVKQCLTEFNDQWLICLTPAERKHNAIMMRVITKLMDFACRQNGDYLGLFIAEEGPACIESNKENISNCMKATFSAYIPAMPPTELPELVMRPKQCIELHDFEKCVLSYVEQCNEETPANVIESLFRYVRNEAQCEEDIHKLNYQQRNVATGTRLSWILYYVTSVVVTWSLTN